MSYENSESKWGAGFPRGAVERPPRLIVKGMLCALIFTAFMGLMGKPAFAASAATIEAGRAGTVSGTVMGDHVPIEERLARIETTLLSVEETVKKAEDRSFYNKMAGREMLGYAKLTVVVLVVIAAIFPLTIWFLSRRRILGLSGLSSEMAATLLLVEERQSKLVALLKEMQSEIDYLHSMPSPDLKNLVQQAEGLVRKNEADLKKVRDSHKEPGQ
jgi:hypothetical protein